MVTPVRHSSRLEHLSTSPPRDRSKRKAAQGAFYTQYFAEGELSEDEDVYQATQPDDEEEEEEEEVQRPVRVTRSGRRTRSYAEQDWNNEEDEEETNEEPRIRPRRSTRVSKSLRDFVATDDEEEEDDNADYEETVRLRHANERAERARRRQNLMQLAAMRSQGREEDDYEDIHVKRRERRMHARSSSTPSNGESDDHGDALPEHRSYSFRARKKVNYSLLPPPPEPLRDGFGRRIRRGSRGRASSRDQDVQDHTPDNSIFPPRLPTFPYTSLPRSMQTKWNPTSMPTIPGAELVNAMDEAMDSSDDDLPRTNLGETAGSRIGTSPPESVLENSMASTMGAVSSSTDALGRLRRDKDALADVDPLGVNMDIDFNQVGGLEDHVQRLKEMVSLPLLYPEVFQRFGVTPPRGVLFHGPPGTGKTLVARALAASCSSEGQSISFFMRKGADCLSKWVGEAERQLRLLFEEAKRAQPSIIFFDEIDGLAPVRSSKQDQIHSSIVSTLLALMDGMDGRGQVVVIGATNRPDSIDPALRRPGRFDREFYFPLPSRAARRAILDIHTRHWDPPLDEQLKKVLSVATNGFGGADLRALCTEATLNAIQRRYPQIYHTNTRLVLSPETIQVDGRDFMLALENMVPSSARASTSSFTPLPAHLESLLGDALSNCQKVFSRLLPKRAKRSALEEAMYEIDMSEVSDSSAHLLERELLQQSFVQAQVHRPRLLLHGSQGMGQRTLADALLYSMEGYHVRTLSAALLLGDSSQTPESILVHQFQEAKRLVPSVLYVPDLDRWPLILPEGVRGMLSALLNDLSPSDTIMLFATSDVPFKSLPKDLQAWFGFMPRNKFELTFPDIEQRREYLRDILVQASRPPTQFADAMPRRLRVLEELPAAPPRPPRMPTQIELKQQAENDARLLEHLKFRLGSILAELRKKFKKFTRDVWDEYNLRELMEQFEWHRSKGQITIKLRYDRNPPHFELDSPDVHAQDAEIQSPEPLSVAGSVRDPISTEANEENSMQVNEEESRIQAPETVALDDASTEQDGQEGSRVVHEQPEQEESEFIIRDFTIYTMTLDKMQKRLYHNQYLTSDAFMDDLQKIVTNAEVASDVDADRMFRAHQMQNLAKIMMDPYVDATFRAECKQMERRVVAREEEMRREAEKRKEQESHSRRLNGQRYSARVQGEEPEAHCLVDVSTIERAHKRARSQGQEERATGSAELDAVPMDAEDHGVKRVRLDDATNVPEGEMAQASANEGMTPVNHDKYPSVLLNEAAQASLLDTMTACTDGFTIEQLELTRSLCYERVLAHRSSWDRSALAQELKQVVQGIHSTVQDNK